jgi:hypothetical protein
LSIVPYAIAADGRSIDTLNTQMGAGMSDRTIQMSLLVVVIALLTATLLALIHEPHGSDAASLAVVIALLSAVIGALTTLMARTPNGKPTTPMTRIILPNEAQDDE